MAYLGLEGGKLRLGEHVCLADDGYDVDLACVSVREGGEERHGQSKDKGRRVTKCWRACKA